MLYIFSSTFLGVLLVAIGNCAIASAEVYYLGT